MRSELHSAQLTAAKKCWGTATLFVLLLFAGDTSFAKVLGETDSVAGPQFHEYAYDLRDWSLLSESVRAELVRLEDQIGLTMAWYYDGVQAVSFEQRSIVQGKQLFLEHLGRGAVGVVSRDGKMIAVQALNRTERRKPTLAIVRPDGSSFQEFSTIEIPLEMCWSYDDSKLAVTMQNDTPDARLAVLDMRSRTEQAIDERAKLTSQCWSPDDRQLVYEADGAVRIHVIGQDKSGDRVLATGQKPTWSPDGNWIAFRDGDSYYAIRPSGKDRKLLFERKFATSGLWWSPDSRIVAYISKGSLLEGDLALDAEIYRLRVRRLADNSEDWVARGVAGGGSYQWITSPEMLKQVESQALK